MLEIHASKNSKYGGRIGNVEHVRKGTTLYSVLLQSLLTNTVWPFKQLVPREFVGGIVKYCKHWRLKIILGKQTKTHVELIAIRDINDKEATKQEQLLFRNCFFVIFTTFSSLCLFSVFEISLISCYKTFSKT